MKRTLAQIAWFLATNLHLKGFLDGTIYRGPFKQVCVPGLNCYSCPGALGSCPIGALQAVIGSFKYNAAYYVAGLLALFGVGLGRFVCGWLCPFGLAQDLAGKIRKKKLAVPARLDKTMRYGKYLILSLVVVLPVVFTNAFGMAPPYFCQYVCPSGTLFGGIPLIAVDSTLRQAAGWLFGWKAGLLLLTAALSVVIYRPFCKYVCPLGAVYALFNRVSLIRMAVDEGKCVDCLKCERACPMQVPVRHAPNHAECIRCGVCKKACPTKAIHNQPLITPRKAGTAPTEEK